MNFFNRLKSVLKHTRHRQTVRRNPSMAQGESLVRVSAPHTYPGSTERLYRIYVPPGYRPDKPLPLIMVLHGCLQDHLDIQAISQFDLVADQHKFIVVYPFVTRYTDLRTHNCWGWWRPEHITPGRGEVADLDHIVDEVRSEFSIDARRIHIAGVSAGGCMAVAALTALTNRFASGAAVAALAYGEGPRAIISLSLSGKRHYQPVKKTVALMSKVRDNDRTVPPLLVVHSDGDRSVHTQAAENLRDSWLGYFGSGLKLIKQEEQHSTHGTPWLHTRYRLRFGGSIVETIFLHGLAHGWYGGAPGRFSYPLAPPLAELMWDFFSRHPLNTIAKP
jgi:poly(hydroxyalkanoate) depolymerase family esterase